jgi:pSer/pThr/pTyr-binding forkhead associated (FHA) protein
MTLKIYYRYCDEVEQCYWVTHEAVVIGRQQPDSSSVDLDLMPDRSISRAHAYLYFNLGEWWIRDLNSKHGTYYNGKRITTQTRLEPGGQLKLGDTVLRFEFSGGTDASVGSLDGTVVTELTVGQPTSSAGITETERIDLLAKVAAIARVHQGQTALVELSRELVNMFPQKAQRAGILLYRDKELFPVAYFPPEKSYVSFTLARRAMYASKAFIWERRVASNSSHLIRSLNDTTAAIYAPMIYNRQIVGILYVDTVVLEKPFTQDDLKIVSEVAFAAAQLLIKGDTIGTFPSVFVSYSHHDREFVDRLVGDLRRKGVSVWLDERLLAGKEWELQIQSAIEATDAFVLIMSSTSLESKYVQSEIEYAQSKGKMILPVLYLPCEIPHFLKKIQYVNVQENYEKGLTELFHELHDLSNLQKPSNG